MPKVLLVFGALTLLGLTPAADAACGYTWNDTSSATESSIANGKTANAEPIRQNFEYLINCPSFRGNVGIGTTSPSAPLQITSDVTFNSDSSAQINVSGKSNPNHHLIIGYDTTNDFGFIGAAISNAGWMPLLLNPNGGKVGIGTRNPDHKLTIRAADGGDSLLLIGDARGNNWLRFGSSGGLAEWGLTGSRGGDGSYLSFYDYDPTGGVGDRLVITNSGNVGIGTTSPAAPLDVNGKVRALEFDNTSDQRLKTGVEPMVSSALAKLMALRPVTFRWKTPKDDGMKGLQIGLIAQEVEKVLPSAVTTARDAMKTKGIKYNELTAVLIKAVQEQQQEITALRAENIELRQVHAKQVADLNSRLDRLERMRLAKAR